MKFTHDAPATAPSLSKAERDLGPGEAAGPGGPPPGLLSPTLPKPDSTLLPPQVTGLSKARPLLSQADSPSHVASCAPWSTLRDHNNQYNGHQQVPLGTAASPTAREATGRSHSLEWGRKGREQVGGCQAQVREQAGTHQR